MAPEGSGAGAGNVDQHRVDGRDRRMPRVSDERQNVDALQTPLVREQALQPREGFVARDDGAGGPRQLERLSSRRGTEIGGRRPARNRSVLRYQRRSRILDEEQSFLERSKLGERGPTGD